MSPSPFIEAWLLPCECCHLVDTTVNVNGQPRCSVCRATCTDGEMCAVQTMVNVHSYYYQGKYIPMDEARQIFGVHP